jgi:predicted phage-related endonuclease
MPPNDEYKFPDELENETTAELEDNSVEAASDEVEVEIIDDTPAKDRNRKPLDKAVDDPTDDEIEGYSDKVQARIKELTHARHDERRRKEELL